MDNTKQKGAAPSLMRLVGPYKGRYLLSVCLSILSVVAGLAPYFAAAQMLIGLFHGKGKFTFYLLWGLVAAAGYVGKTSLYILSTDTSHYATFRFLKDIRRQIVDKLTQMPMGTLLDTPSGQLKDILVDRVESLETPLAHLLPEMSANVLVPLLIVVYLFVLDWRMALISLITLPLGMCAYLTVIKTYPEQYAGSVRITQKMNNAIVEYVGGIEVIKAFNQSAASYGKYSDAVMENAEYYYRWMKSCQWATAGFTSICPGVLITVLPAGVLFYAAGSLSAENLITIMILSLGVVGPLIAASNFADSLGMVGTVIGEVEALLDGPELHRPTEPAELSGSEIQLQNVSFSYEENGENAVEQINLTIRPGTVTAFVGPSGSGKSTVTKLIAGFWDVGSGCITLGGQNLQNIPQAQLAEQIAYVAQDHFLFDDTIRENIRIGRSDASDEAVEAAAKAAGCDGFIRHLEKGYDTNVGGAGSHLSGGERQRIAIARAMLKDAPIVIFDEATANVDPENEDRLQAAIEALTKDKTIIMIAHRLKTVRNADQILVVDGGRIVQKGRHEELITQPGIYADFVTGSCKLSSEIKENHNE